MTSLAKPIRRKALTRPAAHGVSAELVISLHPGGVIAIREAGRRSKSEVFFEAAQLYVQGTKARIEREKAARRAARRRK